MMIRIDGFGPADRWMLKVILILLCPALLAFLGQCPDLALIFIRVPVGLLLGWVIVKWLDSRTF